MPVRVDAGGGLNGALVRAGLADEVSVVIAPCLAASATAEPLHLVAGLGGPAWRWNWLLLSVCIKGTSG